MTADGRLSEEREDAFVELMGALGMDEQALEAQHPGFVGQVVMGRLKDGRLPVADSPRLMARRGEVVHLEVPATLLKEVVDREYRGGYRGVSFRIAKGVSYRVGGVRGRSVVTGSHLEPADHGVLSISSSRAVFLGNARSMEFPYAKLLNLEVFTDGIRLHSSNRQAAPLFRVTGVSGDVVAATLNAAVQRVA